MNLLRGDIILCSGTGLISWLIKKVEHSPWSHVALVVSETQVLEALAQGVVLTPLSKFDLSNHSRYRVVRIKSGYASSTQIGRAVILAKDQLGRPYDWALIFKLAWAWATKKRHSVEQEGSKTAYICSEVIAEPFFAACGIRFRPGIPVGNTAPSDIWRSKLVETVDV